MTRYEIWNKKDYIEHCKSLGMKENKIKVYAKYFFKDNNIIVVDKKECYVKDGIRQEGFYSVILNDELNNKIEYIIDRLTSKTVAKIEDIRMKMYRAFYYDDLKQAFELCNKDIVGYTNFYNMYIENKEAIDKLVIKKFDIH
ncbi:hypothetical protein HYH38_08345 [Clostridium botulinum]|uniref:hypothetical protein n=1 Tax=Clostridium botulinum TaxID=1491 RepID=UPI001C9B6ACD|nr:hypothetical protein [Clostridium botulinum]MBY6816456.1 hypothetical protein [Clostridium botulinum]MBY6827289.1 hypothetical protein [Clostridium botulinum]MBY6859237.1 hypothetical protein [Clostridium botulinum]MBY7041479.1 hypothetical protein [Clostridium botulinum]